MRCVRCEMTDEEHQVEYGQTLEVHRIVPGSRYTSEGCITLCKRCHGAQPKRKKGEPDYAADRHKPRRLVGLPIRVAAALEELADGRETNLTEVVKTACLHYLEHLGKWPPPPPAPKAGK